MSEEQQDQMKATQASVDALRGSVASLREDVGALSSQVSSSDFEIGEERLTGLRGGLFDVVDDTEDEDEDEDDEDTEDDEDDEYDEYEGDTEDDGYVGARFKALTSQKFSGTKGGRPHATEINKLLMNIARTVSDARFVSINAALQGSVALQGSAAHYVNELEKHFTDLRTECQRLKAHFDRKLSEKELPQHERDSISGQQQTIAHILQRLDGGHKHSEPGILPTIAKAKAQKTSIQLQLNPAYIISSKDYPIAAREEHLKRRDDSGSRVAVVAQQRNYKVVGLVDGLNFREHTITSASDEEVLGRFIEERVKTGQSDDIRMTFSHFPEEDDARAITTMAMVTQFISGLKEHPTAGKPLYLEGSNKEELAFVGAALLLIGEKMPEGKRFDAKAIQIDCEGFDLEECKETDFYQSLNGGASAPATLQGAFKQAQAIVAEKFGHEDEHTALKEVSEAFKEAVQKEIVRHEDDEEEYRAHKGGPDGI
jgi:hypothetical protein